MNNYRVKVDLSSFYNDARKLSYVYVDKNTISHVLHLHERIKSVFGINRPFYLTSSDGIYLPLNEDVKIINQEEIITALPGDVNKNCLTVWKEMGVKTNGKPLPTIQIEKTIEEVNRQLLIKNENIKIEARSDSTAGPSTPQATDVNNCDNKTKINETESVAASDVANQSSEAENTQSDRDSVKLLDSSTPEASLVSKKKRKRIRKRKPKHLNAIQNLNQNFPVFPPPSMTVPPPKYIPSGTPQPKHFKFNWDEEEDEKVEVESTASAQEIPELQTLLGLKNSPFPITFFGQKATKETEVNEERKKDPMNVEKILPALKKDENGDIDFTSVNPIDFPTVNGEYQINDVIAFRILKMSSDYTPAVSGYITAELIARPSPGQLSFRIISGQDQLKDPEGKFSLPTEEEEANEMENQENREIQGNQVKIHTMAVDELIEPRLIHR